MMLKVKNLKTIFKVKQKIIRAVDDVSFVVPKNRFIGLVGESGSGKSVTALSILNLLPNNGYIESGSIFWDGKNISSMNSKEIRDVRGADIALIFQNPLDSLNPVFTIGDQMIETIRLHSKVDKKQARDQTIALLKKVNIPDPDIRLHDYPHQFSMGMCQRIMIALTVSMKPRLLIADEPTASLDVTIQAQMLRLLEQLQHEYQMSILLISHDLGIIAQYCDYILVMYLGRIVEKGSPEDIFSKPLHPYTQALISAIPVPDPKKGKPEILLTGDMPGVANLPSGCRFHPRCLKSMPECSKSEPILKSNGRSEVACFLY
ncbi:MAG: ABC transporter ATP-binding protein [bacterium]|nr:ABC transporter ATP-binding protein [bacterium]